MKLTRMSIDWPGFLMSAHVKAMPVETKGIYLLLLGEMWTNEGWLPNDDKLIAQRLGMDVRVWRRHRKLIAPCLTEVRDNSSTIPAGMLVQKRLTREYQHTLELVEKKRAQTEPARAKRLAKTAQAASVTERKAPPVTKPVAEPVTSPETKPVTSTATDGEAEAEKKRALPLQSREPFSSAPTVDVAALPPRVNGHAERSARTGSPSLKGGSPTVPSEALLRSKLVSKVEDDEEPKPKPAKAGVGLFGALEAAIRHGKPEEE